MRRRKPKPPRLGSMRKRRKRTRHEQKPKRGRRKNELRRTRMASSRGQSAPTRRELDCRQRDRLVKSNSWAFSAHNIRESGPMRRSWSRSIVLRSVLPSFVPAAMALGAARCDASNDAFIRSSFNAFHGGRLALLGLKSECSSLVEE
jgi:hypothetical protein